MYRKKLFNEHPNFNMPDKDSKLSKTDRLLVNKFNSNLNQMLPVLKAINARFASERAKELPRRYVPISQVKALTTWTNEDVRKARIKKILKFKKDDRVYLYDQSTIPWWALKPEFRQNLSIPYLIHGIDPTKI